MSDPVRVARAWRHKMVQTVAGFVVAINCVWGCLALLPGAVAAAQPGNPVWPLLLSVAMAHVGLTGLVVAWWPWRASKEDTP